MERKMLTAQEVADYLCLSKEMVYRCAREGTLPAVKIGRRTLFDKQSLDRHFANLEEAQLQERQKKYAPARAHL